MIRKEATHNPVCLSVAGLDPSGGAGIAADIKTFSAFGCYAAAAVTSVTFQNTTGVFGAEHQSAASVRKQLEPVFDDFSVAALKTGMLPTEEIIKEVASIIEERGARNIVVDPVVRSTSGFDLIGNAALRSLIEELFPLADIVTPNLQEAERISGVQITNEAGCFEAAQIMLGFGAGSVLLKGGHTLSRKAQGLAVDRYYDESSEKHFEKEYIDTNSTHGTGCTLSAAIAANLAIGLPLTEAIGVSKEYVTEAIRTAEGIGKGNSPVNHWAGLKTWGER